MEKLDFRQGFVFYKETQCFLFPLNYFLTIIYFIHKKENTKSFENILKKASYNDALIFANKLNKITNTKKINLFLENLNNLGLGEIKLLRSNNNQLIFKIEKLYLSNFSKKIFKKNKEKLIPEIIFIKYIENFLEIILKRKNSYSYKIINNTMIIHFTINEQELKIKKINFKYPQIKSGNISTLMKKVIISRNIKSKNGILKIWTTNGTLIPYCFLLNILKEIDNNKYLEFFKALGKTQGKASVNMHKKLFGTKNSKVFWQVINISDISGLGKNDIKKQTPEKLKFNHNLNSYYNQYYNYSDYELFIEHLISMYIGIYESSFNKEVKAIIDGDYIELKEIKSSSPKSNKIEKEIEEYLETKILVSTS